MPGPKWKASVGFHEQPGVMDHVEHYVKLHGAGKLLLGGPFTDLDAGGMMIAAEGVSREEWESFAASDPAVAAGLLNYGARTWYVAL